MSDLERGDRSFQIGDRTERERERERERDLALSTSRPLHVAEDGGGEDEVVGVGGGEVRSPATDL